ncbi:hypothetical protein TIFTF001_027494 [Ficus carica]|uniref:Uncharacterized protein n=1 Tax=Ficus carica TaxID=3494 RepID=A0AA88IV88_FICCA|nr:hypothetical protein TIFTF001_027494 [Ficus carica]
MTVTRLATAGRVRLKQSVEIHLLSKSLATPTMAFNHLKSFVMPLLLVTNLLILLSNNAFPVEARHLVEATLPELPDRPELPKLPDFSSFPIPELPAGFPKFEFPPLPFFPKPELPEVAKFPELPKTKLPTLGKDHLPSSSEPHSPASP